MPFVININAFNLRVPLQRSDNESFHSVLLVLNHFYLYLLLPIINLHIPKSVPYTYLAKIFFNGLSHCGNLCVLCSQEDDRADNAGKCLSGSLFTSEGLQASYRDLEQIFDNSDTSSDETVSIFGRDVYCIQSTL